VPVRVRACRGRSDSLALVPADFGHDMDNCDTLAEVRRAEPSRGRHAGPRLELHPPASLQVGLAFTADWDKPGGFIGRRRPSCRSARAWRRCPPASCRYVWGVH